MQQKGWHCRGYIPHFDVQGLVQHIVLSTHNALSSELWERVCRLDPAQKLLAIDQGLDYGTTGHIFADDACAAACEAQLCYFDRRRYDLLAWCIMPNHIHVLICCLDTANLGQIVRTWKVGATQAINKKLTTKQSVFAPDYFDRFMRNGAQTERAIAYIENNPVAAGLCANPSDWRYSSAWHRANGWEPNTSNLPLTIA